MGYDVKIGNDDEELEGHMVKYPRRDWKCLGHIATEIGQYKAPILRKILKEFLKDNEDKINLGMEKQRKAIEKRKRENNKS